LCRPPRAALESLEQIGDDVQLLVGLLRVRRRLLVSVPLPTDRVQQLAPSFTVSMAEKGWAGVVLNAVPDLESLGEVLTAAYEHQRGLRVGGAPEPVSDVEEPQAPPEPSGEVLPPTLRVAGDF
jgi:hypothetical protein